MPHGPALRSVAFYFLLSLPILAWALVVVPNHLFGLADISLAIVYAAVTVSPLVGGDVSIFGEVTPVLLAGAILALTPKSKGRINVLAIGLAVLTYALFLHLSVYFSSGPGVGLLAADWSNIEEPQRTILKLVSNVRVMAIVLAAAILGINVKGNG
jgi:hypothetical protein